MRRNTLLTRFVVAATLAVGMTTRSTAADRLPLRRDTHDSAAYLEAGTGHESRRWSRSDLASARRILFLRQSTDEYAALTLKRGLLGAPPMP